MIDGKPTNLPQGQDLASHSPGENPLREMSWSDLRARLEAARDLRSALQAQDAGSYASFDEVSAKRIAAHSEGKEAVYPDDLANGKGTGGKDAPTTQEGTGCHRGNT